MNSNVRTAVMWLIVVCLFVLGWIVFHKPAAEAKSPQFSELYRMVVSDQVESATITQGTGDITGKNKNGDTFTSVIPPTYDKFTDLMIEHGVAVKVEKDTGNIWANFLSGLIPIALVVGFWFFMIRQMQSGGNKALSFGKSRARLHSSQQKKVTFKDVAGVEEAKEELQEIIEFLREPQKFQKLGGRIPKGVLLIGSPGTGKTLLARAIAGEANVPFFSISGSDFVEMFVGVGASRVRDLFEQGKKNAPCIIFIDEIDAVGRHRGAGLGGGHDEREIGRAHV